MVSLSVFYHFQVSESFQSSDPFTQAMHAQQQQQQQQQNIMPLQKPPKWLQKPAGANFGVSSFPLHLQGVFYMFNSNADWISNHFDWYKIFERNLHTAS